MRAIGQMTMDEIICVQLSYGDDFLKCVEQAAREHDIASGVVLSGIGTFDKARIHHIKDTKFPAKDVFVELEGPIELCSVDGIIADYKPHLHTTMAVRGNEMFCGHLEHGCRILYLGEVVIARLRGRELTRDQHPKYGTPRLTIKDGE